MDEEEKKTAGKGRFLFAALFLLVISLAYVAKLADWQILNGDKWLKQADRSGNDTVQMDAARGEIIDAKGVGLAVNKTGYAITFNGATMTAETKNQTILKLVKLLGSRGEKWTDELPITVDAKGNYQFTPDRGKDVAYLKSKSFLDVQSYATADQCMKALIEKYKCKGYSAQDTRNIVSVRYNMTKTGFSISVPYTFADSVDQNTIAVVSENSAVMPGVETKVTTVRQYPDGSIMPQILGTVGAIPAEQYDAYKAKNYPMNARVGTSGVEAAFENWLCGKTGEKTVKLDPEGDVLTQTVTKQPVSGNTVQLSIDSNLQKVINAALAKNVKGAQEYGKKNATQDNPEGRDCTEGSAVVLRVKDFAILAAATYPSYDQNKLSTDANYYSQLLKDNTHPLINRAFNGQFAPGSSFKPSVALAALQEKDITNSTVFVCNGVYVMNDLKLHCWNRYGGHGALTLEGALAESCNVFFCNVGFKTGINAMNLYAKRLGLGVKTGVEIGENSGVLAGPDERKASGGTPWNAGDTVQAAIGQSDNQLTPLQLATYCATIANNGVRLKTHLVDKVLDYSRTKTIYTPPVTQMDNIGVSQQNINYVKAGMRAVVTSGTAAGTFSRYGIAIAGKTGTAQTGTGHSDNEVFIGFAPYDNPQIAVAVMLPHGGTSQFSLGVSKAIFDAYFYGATVDANGNIVIPPAGSPSSGSTSSSASSSAR